MARICFYELLGVERSATDIELKKAYRKQALVWHPDKNHNNAEEATRVFAEIKEAYETLSDPQERAWYDNHREQILRGDDYANGGGASGGNGGAGYYDNYSTNVSYTPTESLMKYFNASSFRGFDDTPTGFFTVYRSLFEKLRDEELQIYDPDTEDSIYIIHNLDFGDSHTPFDEDELYANAQGQRKRSSRKEGTGTTLRDFYNFWTTFSTRKSFGWFDKYRLSDADNRQIKRLMEKENKHLRDKARREFNETVQNLSAWMKKRDPRYKKYVDKQQQLQDERNKEIKRKVAEQRAAIVESANTYVRQAWEEVDYSNHLDEYLSDASDNAAAQEATDGATANNSDSARADENSMAEGRAQDLQDGEELDPENDLLCVTCSKTFKTVAQKENHEKSKKHQKALREIRREMLREERQMAKMAARGEIPSPGNSASAVETADEIAQLSGSDAAQTPEDRDFGSGGLVSDAGIEDGGALEQMIEDLAISQGISGGKKDKKKRRKGKNKVLSSDTTIEDLHVPDNSLSSETESNPNPKPDPETVSAPEDTESAASTPKQLSKKELRNERHKKEQNELKCNVCNKEFASRNQLFNHIKDTGHALANKVPAHIAQQIIEERAKKGKKGKKGKSH